MNTVKGITEDNLVHTADGYISIKDLLDGNYKIICQDKTRYFFDDYANELVKMGDNVRVINLVLTDYGSFKMTPDTQVYLKEGNCKQAKDLTSQDMLFGMPYYHRLKYIMKGGNADIYNLKRKYTHNFYIWDKNYLGDYTGILIDNLNNKRGE